MTSSHRQRPGYAQVIWEPREAGAGGPALPAGPGLSFRAALWYAAGSALTPAPDGGRADVTILISRDGDRLYAERMTSASDGPDAPQWARSFLQLLSALAVRPDVPLTSHQLAEAAP